MFRCFWLRLNMVGVEVVLETLKQAPARRDATSGDAGMGFRRSAVFMRKLGKSMAV